MKEGQLLILDCHGDIRPAICFNLEVAGYEMRVVTEEDEAINLLGNSRLTGESYSALLVNNPYLNIDLSRIVDDVQLVGADIPLVFVKESKNLEKIILSLALDYREVDIFHTVPTRLVDLLTTFPARGGARKKNNRAAINTAH